MGVEHDETSFEDLIPLGDLEVIQQNNRPRYESQSSEDNVKELLSFWKKVPSVPSPSHQKLSRTTSKPRGQWLGALKKTKSMEDPWEKHNIIENCKTERAKRFRFNALKNKWVKDLVLVKMQEESFGQGAMRKCFRMKKLSSTCLNSDWDHASNIVAKRYIEDVLPKTYFDDVKLQMDAKLWAEEYNRFNPPKKVDIIQVACIELIDRKDHPLYHFEHFVEGKYVKYNSNSGFVLHQDANVRATPQAFSHFTFERSGHQMIVVDVQGVGDLYTDPQIHTANEVEYGEANLGAKGMALFFASHQCTEICQDLHLEAFDLSKVEKTRIDSVSSRSSTSTEVKPHSPVDKKIDPVFELVERLQSIGSNGSLSPREEDSFDMNDDHTNGEINGDMDGHTNGMTNGYTNGMINSAPVITRTRLYSEVDSGISSEDENNIRLQYFNKHGKKSSSCAFNMKTELTEECINARLEGLRDFQEQQISILGKIHYELATYNYIGRFSDTVPDFKSALFHLEKASLLGSLEANKVLAYKYFNLHTDQFDEVPVEEDHDRAMDCLIEVATRGDKDCMMKTAKAYDTGINLGTARNKSWKEALKWYEAALNNNDADHGAFDPYPAHEINARMAEIWREGGFGVEKDPSYAGELYTTAAESAMGSGKGKLANKFYMLAEEAWGEVEED